MITLVVNGQTTRFDLDADTPLLYVLRDNLALNGPKFGCGLGQCGACTVLMNGQAVRSCSVPIAKAAGLRITTLEGLGSSEKPTRFRRRSSTSRPPSAVTASTA